LSVCTVSHFVGASGASVLYVVADGLFVCLFVCLVQCNARKKLLLLLLPIASALFTVESC
jgi:hypothetical protein